MNTYFIYRLVFSSSPMVGTMVQKNDKNEIKTQVIYLVIFARTKPF